MSRFDCTQAEHPVAFYMHDLSGGGVERMRLTLIAELRARGLPVCLVVQRDHGPLRALLPPDLPLIILGGSRTLTSVAALARFMRAQRPRVLISSLDHNNIAALVARWMAGTHTPVVICQHNALSSELALGWKFRVVPLLYRILHGSAAAVVAVSDGVAQDLGRAAGIKPERIVTIYNPVIGADFKALAAAPPPHAWLADTSVPTFVFAGRLVEQKDPLTLVRAFALSLAAQPARLLVLGDGPLRAAVERETAALRIEHAVAFVGFQSNPYPWIANAAALILPSRYEGLGNVIVEALACGTPVVATDCPCGPAEILENGRYGILVPPGDVVALARAIGRSLHESWNKSELRARSGSFSAVACADSHLALFESIEARRTCPSSRPILGLQMSRKTAVEVVESLLGNAGDKLRMIVTPNVDHISRLRDQDFAAAYASASLCCPDGLPVLLYARLRGLRLSRRVTGCELFQRLATHPQLPRQRLFIASESVETARAVESWATAKGLSAQIATAVAAPALLGDPPAQDRLVAQISAHAPTILVMTLGAPTSEVFVHRNASRLPPCWALCVGQAVRIELGLATRAPVAWQSLGLEWLWRLRREPRRLAKRYVGAAAWFPLAIWRDLIGRKIGRAAEPAPQETSAAS